MDRAKANRAAARLVAPLPCGASALARSTRDDRARVETGGPPRRQDHEMARDGVHVMLHAGRSGGVNDGDGAPTPLDFLAFQNEFAVGCGSVLGLSMPGYTDSG